MRTEIEYFQGILDDPEIKELSRVEQNPVWHPEGNVYNHTVQVFWGTVRLIEDYAVLTLEDRSTLLWSAILHDLGKLDKTFWHQEKQRWVAYGHEYATDRAERLLKEYGVNDDRVVPLIHCHMLHNVGKNTHLKAIQKGINTEYMANLLYWLQVADKAGRVAISDPKNYFLNAFDMTTHIEHCLMARKLRNNIYREVSL